MRKNGRIQENMIPPQESWKESNVRKEAPQRVGMHALWVVLKHVVACGFILWLVGSSVQGSHVLQNIHFTVWFYRTQTCAQHFSVSPGCLLWLTLTTTLGSGKVQARPFTEIIEVQERLSNFSKATKSLSDREHTLVISTACKIGTLPTVPWCYQSTGIGTWCAWERQKLRMRREADLSVAISQAYTSSPARTLMQMPSCHFLHKKRNEFRKSL